MSTSVVVIYPPGWVRYNVVVPVSITTLVGRLRADGVDAESRDLELECFLHNRKHSNLRKLDMELLCAKGTITEHASALERLRDPWTGQKLRALVRADDAHTWAFSIMGARQLRSSLVLARVGKELGRHIVFGGQFATSHAQELLDTFPEIDAVVRGDGEGPLVELAKKTPRFETKEPQEPEQDAKTLAIPSFAGLNLDQYRRRSRMVAKSDEAHLIVQSIAVLGCVHRCLFCGRPKQHQFSAKPPEQLVDELRRISDEAGSRNIKIEGNELNPTRRYLDDLTGALIDADLGLNWGCYLRLNDLDRELLEQLRESGCLFVRWGIESGAQSFHDRMNKGYRLEEIEQVLRDAHEVGLMNIGVFLIGVPFEPAEEIEATRVFIERCREWIHAGKINPFGLAPDSDLVRCPEQHGIRLDPDLPGAYDELGGLTWSEKRKLNHRHYRAVAEALTTIGVGQSGISSDLVFTALLETGNRAGAQAWLRERQGHLFGSEHFVTHAWNLYHEGERMPRDIAGTHHAYQQLLETEDRARG